MSNPALFFDDWQAPTPTVIPLLNSSNYEMGISTRLYNGTILWGDGTKQDFSPLKNTDATVNNIGVASKTYSPNLTGDIKVYFKGGLKDVYSYNFRQGAIGDFQQQYNIQNLGLFLAQMPNLYSYRFEFYAYSVANRQPTIIGDFAQNPDSVERILIRSIDVKNRATALVLNFNNFKNTSKLKWFRKERGTGFSNTNPLRFIGDIAKIPPLCTHFFISDVVDTASSVDANSAITYTSGKVWASSFDTLQIPIQLTTSELDNLLIDMDNSINTKIGDGIIYLYGYRSSVSDSAVASLQSKGFTVNIKRFLNNVSNADASLLRLDFQNNFDVYSNSGMNIITGGTSNQPTFALSGRKAGEYCAVFNGSQSIKTTTNLPVNSDKVTIAFWMKTTQTTAGFISELSTSVDENNAFLVNINNTGQINKIQAWNRNQDYNNITNPTTINDGLWRHFVAVIDRSQNGVNEIKFYENGVLMTVTKQWSTDNNGNFVNNILYIGQRGGSTAGFIGSLTRLKMYNYPFTPSEVSNLYNSEL